MTEWQWQVMLALIRVVLQSSGVQDYSYHNDLVLLKDAVDGRARTQ